MGSADDPDPNRTDRKIGAALAPSPLKKTCKYRLLVHEGRAGIKGGLGMTRTLLCTMSLVDRLVTYTANLTWSDHSQ